MKRRTFLKGVGTVGGGVVALDQGVRRIRRPDTITIAVYQTDRLTSRFRETGQRETTGQLLAERAVNGILDHHFANSFELNYESLTVPHEVATLPSSLTSFREGLPAAGRSLSNWMEYNRQRSAVDSHVLLSYHPDIETGNGIASPGVLPTCCEPIDRYGIAWMAAEPQALSREAVEQTIAHEIGHTIGLAHSHGTNIEGCRSIMLTRSYARRVGKNVFGERIRPDGKRVSELNELVSERHLRV